MDSLIPGHSDPGPSVACSDCGRDCVFAGTPNTCTCPRHLKKEGLGPVPNIMVDLCTGDLPQTFSEMHNRLWQAFYAGVAYQAKQDRAKP